MCDAAGAACRPTGGKDWCSSCWLAIVGDAVRAAATTHSTQQCTALIYLVCAALCKSLSEPVCLLRVCLQA